MKIWFDTEFIDDGCTIELLSIGLVREDGAELYFEPAEADRARAQADEWLSANVLPNMTGPIVPRVEIARQIIEFAGQEPEFWADHAAYDWVALCQLYGRMIDLPPGWPMYVQDLRALRAWHGDPGIVMPTLVGVEHNALDDARNCRAFWQALIDEVRA